MGIMGMPLDVPGVQSTFPPTACGGNLDCRELTQGAALFLPVAVDGGLFSTGDGHALQGDGEVAGPALNCPIIGDSLAKKDRIVVTATIRSETCGGP